MSDELFRKKSIDKIKSPDELNDYLRVANPGIWIILVAAIVFLIGFCVWGIFGSIETTVPAHIVVNDGKIVCEVDDSAIGQVRVGMEVYVNWTSGVVKEVNPKTGDVSIDISLPEGVYSGEIIIGRIQPMSFVFN